MCAWLVRFWRHGTNGGNNRLWTIGMARQNDLRKEGKSEKVDHFVYSGTTRSLAPFDLTDGQTDGQTDRQANDTSDEGKSSDHNPKKDHDRKSQTRTGTMAPTGLLEMMERVVLRIKIVSATEAW